jgi:uncharacterized protein (TIGR02453 family)
MTPTARTGPVPSKPSSVVSQPSPAPTQPTPAPRQPSPAAFGGFPEEALLFYEGLEADNSKSYWTDRRDVYERAVRGPLQALLDDLEPEFGAGKIFRPYRDVRFSADKSPYKTAAAALVPAEEGGASFYVQISANGLFVGAGCYHMSRDQLARYREAVLQEGPGGELARVGEGLVGAEFELHGERLQRVPRGVDPAHPRADLLRYKGLAAMRDFGVQPWLETPHCREVVADAWRAAAPLVRWLGRHVGPAEETEGERRGRTR